MANKIQKQTKRVPNWAHIIPCFIGLIIIIMFIIALIMILKWNRGKDLILDPDNSDKFITETEDMIYLKPPSTLWGSKDDGEINIVIFGNDTLHTEYNGKTLSDFVEDQLDVNIYNISFPGSYLSSETERIFEPSENPLNAFSFYWLQSQFLTKSYSMQDKALEFLPEEYDRKEYEKTLALLKSIDFSTIDILMIAYDGHDYLAGRTPNLEEEIMNITTMQGSIAAGLFNTTQNFPNMQYIFVSPIFCYYIDENGNRESCEIKDFGQGNLPTGLTPIHNLDAIYEISYLDLFYGSGITEENADQYLTKDGITPNEKGLRVMADRIVKMIGGKRLFVME